uniref:Uncharacterized protein n=1 Tax=Rhizophora mucronata TaxID=61149 RepID=A0A2P2K8U9_RHIMU
MKLCTENVTIFLPYELHNIEKVPTKQKTSLSLRLTLMFTYNLKCNREVIINLYIELQ